MKRNVYFISLLIMWSIVWLYSGRDGSTLYADQSPFIPPVTITVHMYVLNTNIGFEGLRTDEPCTQGLRQFGCTIAPAIDGYGYPYDTSIVTVNMESDYLLDVVSKESNPETGFSPLALKTQAVAARTYAYYKIHYPDFIVDGFIDNSIANQIFIPYQFDRLGMAGSDASYKAFRLDVDPCINPILTTGERVELTYEQQITCAARRGQYYLTAQSALDSPPPIHAEFSADWPHGAENRDGDIFIDPISGTVADVVDVEISRTETCFVADLDYPSGSHGVGMTQRGADRWAKGDRCPQNINQSIPWSVQYIRPEQILFHYYPGTTLRAATQAGNTIVSNPYWRWNPLQFSWGIDNDVAPPQVFEQGQSYPVSVYAQNIGPAAWTCDVFRSYALGYRWVNHLDVVATSDAAKQPVCDITSGGTVTVDFTIDEIPTIPGNYSLVWDLYIKTNTSGYTPVEEYGIWPGYAMPVYVDVVCDPVCGGGGQLDLVFVVDTTVSMEDSIRAVKQHILTILDILKHGTVSYRVALVDFRDFPDRSEYENDYPSKVQFDFTSDAITIKQGIDELDLGYGGDPEETVYSGLMTAVTELSWRTDSQKVFILLTDDLPLDPEPVTNYTLEDVTAAIQTLQAPVPRNSTQTSPVVHVLGVYSGLDDQLYTTLVQSTNGTLHHDERVPQTLIKLVEQAVSGFLVAELAYPAATPLNGCTWFDASGSSSAHGELALYEWDFDGDGLIDRSSTVSRVCHVYEEPYQGRVTIHVQDFGWQRKEDSIIVGVPTYRFFVPYAMK